MNVKSRLKNQAGFTLVELLVIVAIISILASIALAKYSEASELAKTKAWEYNSSIVNKAYATYRTLAGNSYVPADKETGVSFLGAFLNSTLKNGDLPGGACTWTRSGSDYASATCVAAGAAAKATTLFSSTFADASGIAAAGVGSWITDGAGNLIPNPDSSQNRALISGTNGTDYTIELNAALLASTFTGQGKVYGIYYRASEDLTSGYILQYDVTKNRLQVSTIKDGGWSFTEVSGARASLPTNVNASHTLTIQVQGTRQIISVDGVQVINFTDSTYTSGSVGLRNWGSSAVIVSDLTVTKP